MTNFPSLRRRQIHLDFHTSEAIGDIGSDFDPDQFVQVLKEAAVDSITLFAKCHHGWSYYPTKAGKPHPNLMRPDLLGEMMRACAKADIETPVYLSVQWDERVARTNPAWLVIEPQGPDSRLVPGSRHAQEEMSTKWLTLCLTNRPYVEELKAQTLELLEAFDFPGLFFDIVKPTDCVCPNCLTRMEAKGLDPLDHKDREVNDQTLLDEFRHEMSEMIWRRSPNMRIFYNTGHISKFGKAAYSDYSHLEAESLPTGGWGYNHFPSSARYMDPLGIDFLGHTGKFHTSWGEFGGYKTAQALIYETAQMVSLGSKCMIGDQLHPSGVMNVDTYASIAPAYARIREFEQYLDGAKYLADIAILPSEYYHRLADERNRASDDGVVQMLLELHQSFDIIDEDAVFGNYKLIILPDDIPVKPVLASRLRDYLEGGGKILLSGTSGLDPATGAFALDCGLTAAGGVDFDPLYFQTDTIPDLPRAPFVVYSGAQKVIENGAEVLAQLRAPYFNREPQHFCSHLHTPDDPIAEDLGPALTLYNGVGYIAAPIFLSYHNVGQPLYRKLVKGLIDRLVPSPLVRCSLPSAGRVSFMKQEQRYVLHLLYGAPHVRGHAIKRSDEEGVHKIEIIDDIPALGPQTVSLRLEHRMVATDALTGVEIPTTWVDERLVLTIPTLDVHQMIILTDGN